MSSSAGFSRAQTAAYVALIGLASVAIALRFFSVAQPLGIDQSLWASLARGLSQGQRLYVDVWEQRPPGIYLAYWAAFAVFGWKAASIAVLDVLSAAITAASLYWIAKSLTGRLSGALTAALYAALTMPASLYGYGGFLERSVSETFIVNCVAFAAACGVAYRKRRSTAAAFGLGLCLGGAVAFKPNAALYFPALLAWSLAPREPGENWRPSSWLRPALAAALGATVMPILLLLWLWQGGLLPEAKVAVVDFNRWYVGAGFDFTEYFRAFVLDSVWLRVKTDPLWFAGVVGSVAVIVDLVRRRRLPPASSLALCWGSAAVLVIVVNGMRLYNSYFIQALPPLALMAGWWLSEGWSGAISRRAAVAATLVGVLGLLVQRGSVQRVAADVTRDALALRGQMDVTSYLENFGSYANNRGYSARANAELAEYIRQRTQPGDRIFLFGINGAGVYFLSDRLTAQRFLRVNFFAPQDFPDQHFRLDAVVRELAERRPIYLIFEKLHSTADPSVAKLVDGLPEDPSVHALLQAYVLETRIEDFSLYRLR